MTDKDQIIPKWLKILLTLFPFNGLVVFTLSLTSSQDVLFSLPVEKISLLSLLFSLISAAIAGLFWVAPRSPLVLFIYWLLSNLGTQICVISLLGSIYLFTTRVPILSARGGISLLLLVLSFFLGVFIEPIKFQDLPHPALVRLISKIVRVLDSVYSAPTWLAGLLAVVMPVTVVCFVIYFILKSSLSAYGPYSFWNDEIGYWVWLRSFSHVGFDSGYNVPNELSALADFSRFGEASPFYLYLYGGISWITGWQSNLSILINFFILSLAIYLFVHFKKLDAMQMIFLCFAIILTWPVLLYLPLTTHETLNQSIGIALAIPFSILVLDRLKFTLSAKVLLLVGIYIATLVRLSWGLLFVPILFHFFGGTPFRRLALSFLWGMMLYVTTVVIMSYLLPPVNNSVLAGVQKSFTATPLVLLEHSIRQLNLMFKLKQLTPNIAVLTQLGIIAGEGMLQLVRMQRSKKPLSTVLESPEIFYVYVAASLSVAGLAFYLEEGFYRVFTPSLLLIYLLMVIRKDYRRLSSLLLVNVIFFSSYMTFYARLGDYQIIKSNYPRNAIHNLKPQAEIERYIHFDSKTPNPWCNTLLIPLEYYDSRLILIPPGIGISYILDLSTLNAPLKSKYLLFSPEIYNALSDKINVEYVSSLPIGDLYYNLDSGCFQK